MLKRLANETLRKLGYELRYIGNRQQQPDYPLDRQEVAEIHRILREFAAVESDPRWSDLEHLQEYLFDQRLYFFQDLLDKCADQGIEFDGKAVADVGTGTGCLLRFLHHRWPDARLTGFDRQEPLLRLAHRLCPQADFRSDDLLGGAPTPAYDVVFCTEVLEHLTDPEQAVRTLLGRLTERGVLVLTVPDGRTDTLQAHHLYEGGGGYMGHINFWSPESWRIFIERQAAGVPFETGRLATGENVAWIGAAAAAAQVRAPSADAEQRAH